MGEYGYRKLLVWQKADELAYRIYLETKLFPKEETYGIVSQLKRAALSVPTNLVEGTGRQGRKELKRFANIALGSLAETQYLLDFSLRLKHLNKTKYEQLQKLREEVGKLLWAFYKNL